MGYNLKRKELGIRGVNQYTKAKSLGLPIPEMSEETREKISKGGRGRVITKEERASRSISMKIAVEKHPESYTKNNVSGRVKCIDYRGISFKGSWEVDVAKWLDKQNINWQYEPKYFEYEWRGVRKYYPDFYLVDFDIYLEVKGYATDRDVAKWKAVPNLCVLKLNEIRKLREGQLKLEDIID
jgi:hypothetical protein